MRTPTTEPKKILRIGRTGAWRVVLHLEQPDGGTRLHPKAINPANVSLRLRQKLKAVDPNPVVMNKEAPANVPWSVQ